MSRDADVSRTILRLETGIRAFLPDFGWPRHHVVRANKPHTQNLLLCADFAPTPDVDQPAPANIFPHRELVENDGAAALTA
ncbi:hypothetical protein [Mesorhizobium sp. NZP2077]|uniref:hypothetical protein n=1 Tax=Mesorhizobium sp. NZP2077 TaxID=2483404 RepID=UPI001556EEE4|nr:hypothetical protein [Mesorhizobium sp. NZP2077]QKD17638.1 hypothetical protein HGP13_22795 [Mesorhizobium sp. NZP2077]